MNTLVMNKDYMKDKKIIIKKFENSKISKKKL
jgi:hypothetical protein